MNKFMKHQKLQFNSGSFRLAGLLRVVFLMCCLLSAGLTQAQEKKITAEFKDTPLSNVLKQLEKLSTYKILFTYDDVPVLQSHGLFEGRDDHRGLAKSA